MDILFLKNDYIIQKYGDKKKRNDKENRKFKFNLILIEISGIWLYTFDKRDLVDRYVSILKYKNGNF